MIHIRYKALPPGMHAVAERGTRGVVIYLLPGLTPAQRNAVLRRLRQEGSRGCGPRLPSGQLAAALAADRLRVGAGNTGAVVRRHPVGTLVPALLAVGLLTAFVLASMSVTVPGLAPVTGGADSRLSPAGPPGQGSGSASVSSDDAGASRLLLGPAIMHGPESGVIRRG